MVHAFLSDVHPRLSADGSKVGVKFAVQGGILRTRSRSMVQLSFKVLISELSDDPPMETRTHEYIAPAAHEIT